MKWIIAVAVLTAVPAMACQTGFKPSDVEGVCIEVDQNEVNPTWRSDEKPPSDKMPSYQRPDVIVVDAQSMASEDEKADLAKVTADKEGKRRAGIK